MFCRILRVAEKANIFKQICRRKCNNTTNVIMYKLINDINCALLNMQLDPA